MTITYQVLSQYQKQYGVEVAVQFHDDDTNTTLLKQGGDKKIK